MRFLIALWAVVIAVPCVAKITPSAFAPAALVLLGIALMVMLCGRKKAFRWCVDPHGVVVQQVALDRAAAKGCA